jgi:hypothetical protein
MKNAIRSRWIRAMIVMAALSALAVAAERPNFSGEWQLDLDKSSLGPMGGPASMSQKVEHADPDMTVTRSTSGGPQGDQTVTLKYSTDGKETTNMLMGLPVKTVASWEGSALVIKMTADANGQTIQVTDRVTLSDDGKVMTDNEHLVLPQAELDLTLVLNKK